MKFMFAFLGFTRVFEMFALLVALSSGGESGIIRDRDKKR